MAFLCEGQRIRNQNQVCRDAAIHSLERPGWWSVPRKTDFMVRTKRQGLSQSPQTYVPLDKRCRHSEHSPIASSASVEARPKAGNCRGPLLFMQSSLRPRGRLRIEWQFCSCPAIEPEVARSISGISLGSRSQTGVFGRMPHLECASDESVASRTSQWPFEHRSNRRQVSNFSC